MTKLKATISVTESQLGYRVTFDSQEFIAWSPLGLDASTGDFRANVKILDEGRMETINRSYDLRLAR